jgi:chemotaxis protein methyltransferase CheR
MSGSFATIPYSQFRNLILTRTGLDFPPERRADFESWLQRALDQIQDSVRYFPDTMLNGPVPATLDDLYAALERQDTLAWDTVIDALTVCETHFFRNTPQFDALRDHILPGIIAERRQANRLELNLWSAGCASGEEAYSLAILLRELLPDWPQWQLTILGTDLNKRSLGQARHGIYRDWSFREAHAQIIRDRYFDQIDNRYHLHNDIRQMVRFEPCSLVESCPAVPDQPSMDLILCRNVLLYLGRQVRRWVYQRLEQALIPGGWLVIGHADPQPPNFSALETYHFGAITVYRNGPVRKPEPRPSAPPRTHIPDPQQAPPRIPDWQTGYTLEQRNDANAHYRLGRWHANRQHWNEALYHCEQAVTLAPTYTEVYYTLALIQQSLGSPTDAIEALRRAIYLARDWALPRFTLAGIYAQSGDAARARRELRNVIDITGKLPPETPIDGGEGMTAARLQDAAHRQLATLTPPED